MSENLTQKKCQACEGFEDPLTERDIEAFKSHVDEAWQVSEDNVWIVREFSFENFVQALEFVNTVGDIAESEGHHPDIELSFGKAVVHLSTHAIGGLSENDFIMAAKIDEAYSV